MNRISKNLFLFLLFIGFNNIVSSQDNQNIDMTVAADGSGDYTSIQEAINNTKSFPYERITILIKKGTYHEKVKLYEWNTKVTLLGEDKEHTIITFNDHFKAIDLGRNSTFHTPTLQIDGNNCILKNLTVVNSAGKVGQAIALTITADKVKVENCNLIGNQDTVYLTGKNHKQYFYKCHIEGTTDFIFGQATAVFRNCTIRSKDNSYITAASTPEDVTYGFIFMDCKLTTDKTVDKVYLGRPWRFYAKTVFLNCEMGKHIVPQGWNDWNKPESHQNSFYAEYKSTGLGGHTDKRVDWSHQLSAKEAKKYTLKTILKSNEDDTWYK